MTKGGTLSKDDLTSSIRIWDLPPLSQPTRRSARLLHTINSKAVSCLDYFAQDKVLTVGYHDVGRVQIWRQVGDVWQSSHVLNGHLHGIRVVA